MGTCLSCVAVDAPIEGKDGSSLQPKRELATKVAEVDATSRWPDTTAASTHPFSIYIPDGQTNLAVGSPVAVDTTVSDSSVEVATPSPTYLGASGEGATAVPDRADLLRTPAGPLESSPSAESASSSEIAARNKCVSALFDKATGSEHLPEGTVRDFDIPAVRNVNPERSVWSQRDIADLADLPLSDFKSRQAL